MAVLFRLTLSAMLLVLVTLVHASIMVRTIEGSFVPLSFERRAASGPIGVPLKNNNDLSYLTPVLMGTPPQQIQMAPSLSQNFISVESPQIGVSDQSFYNPSISTSHSAGIGTASTQTISGGTVQGSYEGEICTLQSSTSALTFTYNASILSTDPTVTNDLYPIGAYGVLGYGIGAPPNSPQGTSLVGSFIGQVLGPNFTSAVCGIELNHMDDPVPDGLFMMGEVDPTAFTGNFTNVMVPPSSPTSWSIAFDNLTYISNGTSQSMPGMLASVDMYHPGIQIASDAAAQVYAGVPGSQAISSTLWSLPCTSKFPITLTFAGTPFTITERDTIVKQADGSCTGAVTGGAQGIGQIGAAFMRNVYTTFFADQASNGSMTFGVGFATKNVRQAPASSPTSSQSQLTVRPTATGAQSTSVGKSSGSRLLVQDGGCSLKVAIVSVAAIILTFGY